MGCCPIFNEPPTIATFNPDAVVGPFKFDHDFFRPRYFAIA
jgi:hypothetical protein